MESDINMAPSKESSALEKMLDSTEANVRRAHCIVDRMVPSDSAKGTTSEAGIIAATARINEELSELCDRLQTVADKVGLL